MSRGRVFVVFYRVFGGRVFVDKRCPGSVLLLGGVRGACCCCCVVSGGRVVACGCCVALAGRVVVARVVFVASWSGACVVCVAFVGGLSLQPGVLRGGRLSAVCFGAILLPGTYGCILFPGVQQYRVGGVLLRCVSGVSGSLRLVRGWLFEDGVSAHRV